MRPQNRRDATRPRSSRPWNVAQVRQVGFYQCRGCATYRLHVTSGDVDPWTDFLKGVTTRPGWSVARLAEESGIHRATIYRWLKGDIKNVTVESVRMIAKGGEVSLAAALHAARAHTMNDPVDSADEDDFEARRIRESNLSAKKKRDLLAHLARRRAQLSEEVDLLIRSSEKEPDPEPEPNHTS
jgi:transcriptional regulator with XRE-family HTH domain